MTFEQLKQSPKSYQEDFSHENGNYYCRCLRCENDFIGHKRRVICKECLIIAFGKEELPSPPKP